MDIGWHFFTIFALYHCPAKISSCKCKRLLLQRDLLDFSNVVDGTWQNSFLTNDRTQCFLSEHCPNHHIVSFIPLLFFSTFSCYCFFRKPTLISPTFYSVESQTYIVLCQVNIWESHSALIAKTVKSLTPLVNLDRAKINIHL